MAASSPLAASPGRAPGAQTTSSTGGQVTMVANTPIAAGEPVARLAQSNSTSTTPDSLFDPSLIPTIKQRIRLLFQLIISASNDINSLSIPQQDSGAKSDSNDQPGPPPTTLSSFNRAAPDIVMGATTEDDVTSGYEAALALSLEGTPHTEKVKRTELAHKIVIESQGLRDAFQRTRRAIDSLEGGEMDLEEQDMLITLLQDYSQQQRRVRDVFAQESHPSDVVMSEA